MPSAIVTGSDSGIGKATAVVLAGDGFDVGITCRSDDCRACGGGCGLKRPARRTSALPRTTSGAARGPQRRPDLEVGRCRHRPS